MWLQREAITDKTKKIAKLTKGTTLTHKIHGLLFLTQRHITAWVTEDSAALLPKKKCTYLDPTGTSTNIYFNAGF